MKVVGIDPGLTGAVAHLSDSGEVLALIDTPTAKVGTKTVYLAGEMARLIRRLTADDDALAAILEDVHPMPKQGVVSTGSIMRCMGLWEGILAAYAIPYELVSPQRWKKVMMNGMGKDKDASRIKALQLFPGVSSRLERKKDHGRAEALLIAEYRRRLG